MKKMKLFAAASVLTCCVLAGTLSGCTTVTHVSENPSTTIEEVQQTKIFQPGEHILFKEISYYDEQIVCPDGYEFCELVTRPGTITKVVYINDEPVECIMDKNGEYTDFGTPIEYVNTKSF